MCNLTGLTGGASQTSTPYGKANHEGLPHYDKELMRAYIMVFDANNQVKSIINIFVSDTSLIKI